MAEIYGETFEHFEASNRDEKGRVFGYVVGLRENVTTGKWSAWVQRSIKTKDGFKDFGVAQRSREFDSLSQAKTWAYSTRKERAAA